MHAACWALDKDFEVVVHTAVGAHHKPFVAEALRMPFAVAVEASFVVGARHRPFAAAVEASFVVGARHRPFVAEADMPFAAVASFALVGEQVLEKFQNL